jgi:hypothetical protein
MYQGDLTMRMLAMASAVALCTLAMSNLVSAAAPAYTAQATLVTPVSAASETEISGVTWRCEGDQCEGKGDRRGSLDSYMKECRKVAEALGELSAYSSRGRDMSKRDIQNCNKLAGKGE